MSAAPKTVGKTQETTKPTVGFGSRAGASSVLLTIPYGSGPSPFKSLLFAPFRENLLQLAILLQIQNHGIEPVAKEVFTRRYRVCDRCLAEQFVGERFHLYVRISFQEYEISVIAPGASIGTTRGNLTRD